MFFLLLLVFPVALAQQWTPQSYPNPRKGGFKECKMRSVSSVCDPDEILTEGERYRLNNELVQLASRTEEKGNSFCARKGVDAVLAIMQDSASQKFADDLNKQWNLDGQCQKSVVFVLSAGDRKLYYSGEEKTGINPNEFLAIVAGQEITLRSGQYTTALVNIFKELGKKTNPVEYTETPDRRPTGAIGVILPSLMTLLLPLAFL